MDFTILQRFTSEHPPRGVKAHRFFDDAFSEAQPWQVSKARRVPPNGFVKLSLQCELFFRIFREEINRPGQRECGRVKARDHQRCQLVAQLLMAELLCAAQH